MKMSWARSPLGRAGRDEAGVLDYAITFPLIMTLVVAAMQTALIFAAHEAAVTAAQQGADAARAQGATIAQGDAAACSYAATAARGILGSPSCTGTGGATVTVRVCGTAPMLLPGIPLHACAEVSGPRERFTTP